MQESEYNFLKSKVVILTDEVIRLKDFLEKLQTQVNDLQNRVACDIDNLYTLIKDDGHA
jgi:hypothetical protein